MGYLSRRFMQAVAVGSLLLLAPKPVPTTPKHAKPNLKRPTRFQNFVTHPNKHFLKTRPTRIGILGEGTAGATVKRVLNSQGYQVQTRDCKTLGKSVASVQQLQDSTWVVCFDDGTNEAFDFLVFALGSKSIEEQETIKKPNFEAFTCPVVRTTDPTPNVEGKRVVLRGTSLDIQTAAIAAVEAQAGSVTVLCPDKAFPWTIDLMDTSRVTQLLQSRFGDYAARVGPESYRIMQGLVRPYWWLLDRAQRKGLPEQCDPGTASIAESIREFGIQERNHKFMDLVDSGQITLKIYHDIQDFGPTYIITDELEAVECDVLILSGESRPGISGIHFLGVDGSPMSQPPYGKYYGGGIVPGMANAMFMDTPPWNPQMAETQYEMQAQWLVEVLRGAVALPTMQAMSDDVQESSFRSPLSYLSSLLSEIGVETWRKGRFADELFGMYGSRDFESVSSHWV